VTFSARVDGKKGKSNDAFWDVQHPLLTLRNMVTFTATLYAIGMQH